MKSKYLEYLKSELNNVIKQKDWLENEIISNDPYACADNDTLLPLLGEVIVEYKLNFDTITFTTFFGEKYRLEHEQDCCEDVYIEDITGDLDDLLNSPILEVNSIEKDDPSTDESATWSFYNLRTRKGGVTIRFYGSSNGYYGETATLIKCENNT